MEQSQKKPIVLLTSGIYPTKNNNWRSDLDAHITYASGAELFSKKMASRRLCFVEEKLMENKTSYFQK